jgi:hypothetical protein
MTSLYVNDTPVRDRWAVQDAIRACVLDPNCRIRLIEFRSERIVSHNGHRRTTPIVYYIDCYYESHANIDGKRIVCHQIEPIPQGSYCEQTVLRVINNLRLQHQYK